MGPRSSRAAARWIGGKNVMQTWSTKPQMYSGSSDPTANTATSETFSAMPTTNRSV